MGVCLCVRVVRMRVYVCLCVYVWVCVDVYVCVFMFVCVWKSVKENKCVLT